MPQLDSSVPATREPHRNRWVVVTFKKPLLWARTDQETWMFNPPRRYILDASQLDQLAPHIETMSDLKSGRHYNPLRLDVNLHSARILIERRRDRGLGDLLFLTGPLSYIHHLAGGAAHIDLYGFTDRHQILVDHPALRFKSVLAGPTHYDDLPLYTMHWFVDPVTEFDEEPDQLNVYDALFKQLGVDPAKVPPQYKRPSITLTERDTKDTDSAYFAIFQDRKIDLRTTPYYVLSPIAYGSMRASTYALWLEVARELAKVRPVVVVGHVPNTAQVPATDMSVGEFIAQLNELGRQAPVINLIGDTPVRALAGIIAKARCVVSLDSGLLYVAQALRVPCVSLWGTHAPHSRIGYDQAYMQLAIWNRPTCPASPCFAYAAWPKSKCPRAEQQRVCEPLLQVTAEQVIVKVKEAEQTTS